MRHPKGVSFLYENFESVPQQEEHPAHNRAVAGSSPAVSSNKK